MLWDQTTTGNNFLTYLLNIFWYQDNDRIIEGHETYGLVFYFVTLMIQIGGGLWLVLGTIRLASSFKERSGSGIQSSIWQMAGGIAVILVMQLFGSVLNRSFLETLYLVHEILLLACKYIQLGGAFWAIFGVLAVANAFKNFNSPELESGIWQIVGGTLVVSSGILLRLIIKGIGFLN
ncbi:MAG: hypothetical protein LBJ93_01910 [Clostridiales bacterium]|nr:hypothetical protein [Clostridiales bacterium]